MKTAKEFVERLQKDEAFSREVNKKIQAKKDAGAKDYTEALLVAAGLGYEVTKEQVDALIATQSEEVSEEELGKTAGGTSCIFAIASVTLVLGSAATGVAKMLDNYAYREAERVLRSPTLLPENGERTERETTFFPERK